MIYECIQCQARQLPGDLACPHCGAQFAGPVPTDATLEEEGPAAAPPFPDLAQTAATASPFPDVGRVGAIPPPPMMPPPMMPPPLTSAAMPTTTYMPSSEPARAGLPPLLLFGAGVGLLAILGVVYLIFSAGQSAVSSQSYTPPPVSSLALPISQPLPPQPMTSTAGGAAPAGQDTAQAAPVGRWMTKTFDFYEFDKDGTGSRGSVSGGKTTTSFSWTVVKNQLILSTAKGGSGQDKVPFSYGPGGDSLYLRQPSGSYVEYSRAPQ